jgi:predicted DNA-binding transcriptional regulator AlpA
MQASLADEVRQVPDGHGKWALRYTASAIRSHSWDTLSIVKDSPESPPESALLDLVDVNTTADMAGIRPATVHQHLAKGTIPAPEIRIGNAYAWRRQTIEEWLQNRRRPGQRGPQADTGGGLTTS